MLDDWQHLLRKVKRWESANDQDLGARRQLLKRLKAKFGCSSAKEAEELLQDIMDRIRKIAKEYTALRKELDRKYGKKLKEFEDGR